MHEIAPVILAAGKGSRLGIDSLPKPMVPVNGRPLMQNAVESLFRIGFSKQEIYAVVGYKGEVVRNYFKADISYVRQNTLNGNAGALDSVFSTIDNKKGKNFLVVQGDDSDQATPENLRRMIEFHVGRGADLTVLTVNKPDPTAHKVEYLSSRDGKVGAMTPIASVDSNGRYTAGIYIFSGSVLEDLLPVLKEKTLNGAELGISNLIRLALEKNKNVVQFCSPKNYISFNTPRGLARLRERGIQ